jgi:hypothetical protein
MSRMLSILALTAICVLSGRASADTLKPHESVRYQLPSALCVHHMASPRPRCSL